MSNVAIPLVMGHAIEVPLMVVYPLSPTVEKTSTPFDDTVGVKRPSSIGPKLLKSDITPVPFTAPTYTTFFARAKFEPYSLPQSPCEFPAE